MAAVRNRDEETNREGQNRFQKIVEQAPIAMAIVSLEGVIEFINRKAVSVFGYVHDDIPTMEKWWIQAYPDEKYRKEVIADWGGRVTSALSEGREIIGNEYRVTCKDGGIRTMLISGVFIEDKIFVLFDDITERMRAADDLRKSEERYRRLVETTDTGYVIVDSKGIVLDANPEYLRLSGHVTLADVLGRNVVEWTAPEEREANASAVAACMRNGAIRNLEVTYIDKNGKRTPVEINATMLEMDGTQKILSLCRDITKRKRAEDAQKQTASLLRATLESTADGILVVDLSGSVVSYNGKFGELWRIPRDILEAGDDGKLLSFILDQLTDPDLFLAKVKTLYAQPRQESFDTIEFKDGRVFERYSQPQQIDEVVAGRVWSFRDITERRKTESLLTNAQRLESLGVLAGGIAHDFNNLLAGIFGYVDLARSVSKDGEAIDYLEATLATMNRARALTLQLLTFAKGGAPVQRITPLIPFIQETAQFALSGSNTSCRFAVPRDLWACNIDKNQICQVIDNIVINAQQAMPNGGTIEISAENISIGEKPHPLLAQGDYVKVSIRDFGIGITKEILPRIFDPFYTTKTKGHGLGLATCYSIINRHGGCIDVESVPGRGSTFHVFLPASPVVVVTKSPTTIKHTGSGTIIVVDDEEVIRTTLGRILESLGYVVVCRNDGKEAIDFYINEIKAHHRIVAMIFDLTIPGGMGGIEAVAEIRKMDRDVPVFVASGYADNSAMKNPTEYGFTASISKPFTIAELSEMLGKCVTPPTKQV